MNPAVLIVIFILFAVLVVMMGIMIMVFAKTKKDIFSKEGLSLVSDVGALKSLMATVENNQKLHQQIVQELKDSVNSDSKTTDSIQRNMENTLRTVESIRHQHEESQKRESENFQSLKRLEAVIAGSKQKGIAGENILREALSIFPPDMIEINFKVRGKEVEFGLVLSNKKVMPIDSKWPSTELLEDVSKEEDPVKLERLMHKVQKEVGKRVSEVSQYLDPNTTTPWAIAAIPDSMYSLCRDAHLSAYSKNVILVSYSMLLPYLLMFFSLHLQYASSIDIENLSHYLIDIKRNIEQMGEILENRVERARALLSSASDEYRQILGTLKGSLSSIETQKPAVLEKHSN
jgi:DNA recombination protein RmuC